MEETSNFIKTIMADDLASGRVKEIITRFPPEPNAYLHIGHARAIITDFETAAALVEKQIFVLMILIQLRKNKNLLMRLLKT